MKLAPPVLVAAFAFSVVTVHAGSFEKERAENWHHWRGPDANGVSTTAKPPLEWSEEKNVRWKVKIEGQGCSSPIVWGDQVFVLTAINTGKIDPKLPKPEDQPKRVFGITHPNTEHRFVVLALDRKTGKTRWRRVASSGIPHNGTHKDNDFASASPTTDGERLYCWFGSSGLFCFDLAGKKLWERDLGKVFMGASLGEGCSPVIHDGKVIINRDQAQQSTIEVLDAKTGKELWKIQRDEGNAWATPRVLEHSGKTQVITTGSNKVRSYDLRSGKVIWECAGLTGNCIPCPVVEGDLVFCMSGYKGYSLLALPLWAKGDITDSPLIKWTHNRGTPYVPSPLLYDGYLYFNQSNTSILSCRRAQTGDVVFDRTRIPGIGQIYASPVGANGRVYIPGRRGTTVVLERGKEFKVLATNKLDDPIDASPALAGDAIFLRGSQFMYCIAAD